MTVLLSYEMKLLQVQEERFARKNMISQIIHCLAADIRPDLDYVASMISPYKI
jgi:hypothetical protein